MRSCLASSAHCASTERRAIRTPASCGEPQRFWKAQSVCDSCLLDSALATNGEGTRESNLPARFGDGGGGNPNSLVSGDGNGRRRVDGTSVEEIGTVPEHGSRPPGESPDGSRLGPEGGENGERRVPCRAATLCSTRNPGWWGTRVRGGGLAVAQPAIPLAPNMLPAVIDETGGRPLACQAQYRSSGRARWSDITVGA